ncbi:TonB-dependent receptor [Marinoscillum sp. MHG1-6]|uniref:SusC/RagA family TonB-linked outer membrane protein n=1 Tax=Marinoscillum sp. MHG1-6 TaxID=2959627 RepID=UPI002157FD27|nr:TonB-dependent receptor [Marinoscillum sp. MHG1-6]
MSKLTVYAIVVCQSIIMAMANESSAQRKHLHEIVIELRFDQADIPVPDIIGQIESTSDFKFAYSKNDVKNKNISITSGKWNFLDLLNRISMEGRLSISRINETIALIPVEDDLLPNVKEELTVQESVSGTITDENGEPLPGATVIEKGTMNGTITDVEGNFNLSVKEGAVIVVTFVGYQTREIATNGQSFFEISLKVDSEQLEEVVVVGYGVQKKETLTGSVTSVKGKELENIPVTNVSQGLAGRLPGVVAISNGGEPGYDGATILIRGVNTLGNTSPLIVVDGVPGRSLERINPNTIESISVLKDASAAIYGAQAANGVILITTKKGTTGEPTVNVMYNYGITAPTIMPKMTNSAEYATLLNEIDVYAGGSPRYSEDEIQKFRDGSDPWSYPNSNYFEETLKPWSPQIYGNVSIDGGSEKLNYFVSSSIKTQDGFYRNSATYFNQYDLRSNFNFKINEYIELVTNLYGRFEDRNFPQRGAGEIFNKLMRSKPTIPAYWPNGLPGPGMEGGDNPVVLVTDQTGYSRDKWYTLNSDFRLNVDVPWVEGLSLGLTASVDKGFNFIKNWSTPWTVYSWDKVSLDANNNPLLVGSSQGLDDPRLYESMIDKHNLLTRSVVNYERNFADAHNLKLMAGVEKIVGGGDDFWAFRRHYVSTTLDQLFAGGQEDINNGGSAYEETRLNYFGRVNYSYKEKYLAEFLWRYQASYIFEESSRYGFFPGVSLGYIISEENFWQGLRGVVNFAKIRASWGQTGNDLIEPYQFLSPYQFGNLSFITGGGSEANKALIEGVIANDLVTWESSTQKDIGIDLEFLDGEIAITADYFYNERKNILIPRRASVPNTAGLLLPDENIGAFENKGFDFNIQYRKQKNELFYSVSLNGVHAKNKVLFWDENPGAPEYSRITGRPLDAGLYYQAIGIFQNQADLDYYPHLEGAQAGDIIFNDYNGDGVIDANDMVRYNKSRTPIFTGGANFNLKYKGFDVTVLFQGAFGGVFYQGTESGDFGNFLKSFYDNRWTEENPSTEHPRTYNRTGEYWVNRPNTYWLHKTDYVRLKNVELGYTIPNSLSGRIGVENCRVYVNGFNLATYSPDMTDFDPENVQGQYAGYNYPLNKAVNFGMSLTF